MTCRPTTITCRVTERVTLHVCAPQRVQPPALIGRAVCRGASTVVVRGVCVRSGRAVCAGVSSVTVRGSAVRAGRAVVTGASSVVARAQVAHNMEHIKRIFGESSIAALFACDESGVLKDYVTPRWSTVDDAVGNVGAPPMSDYFSPLSMDILSDTGTREYSSGPLLKTFSVGVFIDSAGVNTTPIGLTNNTIIYLSTSGRMMIRNDEEAANHYSPTEFVNYNQNEFMVWSANESAGEMYLQASGGTHTINDYPSLMDIDRFRLIHQANNGGEPYIAQFFVILDRLMTDEEIAQVRALL